MTDNLRKVAFYVAVIACLADKGIAGSEYLAFRYPEWRGYLDVAFWFALGFAVLFWVLGPPRSLPAQWRAHCSKRDCSWIGESRRKSSPGIRSSERSALVPPESTIIRRRTMGERLPIW